MVVKAVVRGDVKRRAQRREVESRKEEPIVWPAALRKAGRGPRRNGVKRTIASVDKVKDRLRRRQIWRWADVSWPMAKASMTKACSVGLVADLSRVRRFASACLPPVISTGPERPTRATLQTLPHLLPIKCTATTYLDLFSTQLHLLSSLDCHVPFNLAAHLLWDNALSLFSYCAPCRPNTHLNR